MHDRPESDDRMKNSDAPYHAHIYYDPAERPAATALRDQFGRDPAILFVGAMADGAVGPHPIAQYEVHFLARSRDAVVAAAPDDASQRVAHATNAAIKVLSAVIESAPPATPKAKL